MDTKPKNKKKMSTTTAILLGIAAYCSLMLLGGLLLFVGMHLGTASSISDPPRPEITYGEFPFRVEYEVYGELVVMEDTIVCEFDGFNRPWDGSKTRKWKASFASGRKTLFKQSAAAIVDGVNQIYFALGAADYYMGEQNYNLSLHVYQLRSNRSGGLKISPDELFNTYNIRVISYEFSPPIVNSFK